MAMTPDERRAIIGCVFASACILCAPGEFRAGACLLLATAVLTFRHVVLSRREAKNQPAPSATAPAGPAPPPSATPTVETTDPLGGPSTPAGPG
jgi:hypothetical protein